MAQVIVAPGRAIRCRSTGNGIPVNKHLDGANIAREVACICVLYWLLGSSVHKQALRDGETNPYPTCKHSLVSVESDVVNSRLMLERRYAHVMETFLVWLVF